MSDYQRFTDAPAREVTVTVTTLEQPARLFLLKDAQESVQDYETGWAALTAAGWAFHLGEGVPTKIALANGDEVSAERIGDEYERMLRRKDFG